MARLSRPATRLSRYPRARRAPLTGLRRRACPAHAPGGRCGSLHAMASSQGVIGPIFPPMAYPAVRPLSNKTPATSTHASTARHVPYLLTTCLARTSLHVTRHRAQSLQTILRHPASFTNIHLGKRARAKLSDHEGMAALRWVTLPGIDESMVPPPGRSLPITGRTGRKLLLLRTHRGELSCLDASCFHQGEDLSHGEILDIEALGTVVQCPRHGAGRRDQTLGLITTSILEPLPTPRAACAVCLQAAAWML